MSNALVAAVPQGLALPAHLMTADAAASIAAMNAAAAGGIKSGGFPKISIEGGKFHEVDSSVDGGTPRTYMNPADPATGQPATPMMCLQAVVIAANPALVKTYYAKKWVKGDDQSPDCQSTNGVTPDVSVVNKQSPVCATCPQNQWGSKISEASGKEVKACNDSKQMVVVPGADLNYKALGLAVTPAALGDWGKYVKALSDRNIPVNSVVTNITFDPTASFPKLQFAFSRFLTPDEYALAVKRGEGDDVKTIVSPVRTAPIALPPPVSQPAAGAPPIAPVAPPPAPVVVDPYAGQAPHVKQTVDQMGGLASATGAAMYKTLTGLDAPFANPNVAPMAPAAPPAPVAPPVAPPAAQTPAPVQTAGFGAATPAAVPPAAAAAPAAPKKTRRTREQIDADNAAAAGVLAQPATVLDLSYLPPAIKATVEAVGANSQVGRDLLAQFPPPANVVLPQAAPGAAVTVTGPAVVTPPPAATVVAPAAGFGAAPVATPAPVAAVASPATTSAGVNLKALLEAKLGKHAATATT